MNLKLFVQIVVLMFMVSCVHPPNVLYVRVSSFSEPEFMVRHDTPICFSNKVGSEASIEIRSRYPEIVQKCSEVAKRKGIVVVDPGDNQACLIASIGWYAGEGKSYYLGSSSSCTNIYGSVFCSNQENKVTLFGKGIQLDFTTKDPIAPKIIHQIRATLSTPNPGFLDATAVALCRAAFQGFPEKMVEQVYTIEL